MRASRQLLILSAAAALACALVYAIAVGTDLGRGLDNGALPAGASGPNWARAHVAAHRIVDSIHVVTLALAAAIAVVASIRRGRNDLAWVAVVTLAGANLTTLILKPLLGRADPFGGEALRRLSDSYPSGHATAAMSIAVVAVMVVPHRSRGWVALAAAGYAAAVGIALVSKIDHYPSDVVGGYLVATAWAAGASSVAVARRDTSRARAREAGLGWSIPAPAGWALAALLVALTAALLIVPPAHLRHGLFAVAAMAIAAFALLLPVALTVVLARSRAAPPPRG